MKYHKNKQQIINYAFSSVNYQAIINMAKTLDVNANLNIFANKILCNNDTIKWCMEYYLEIKHEGEWASVSVQKEVSDASLLNTLKAIHQMEPEEMDIEIICEKGLYYCCFKIEIIYYENVAIVLCDNTIPKKEINRLCSECFD